MDKNLEDNIDMLHKFMCNALENGKVEIIRPLFDENKVDVDNLVEYLSDFYKLNPK